MKRDKNTLKDKLNAECLKRSKFGTCNMECELPTAIMKYCIEVWKAAVK